MNVEQMRWCLKNKTKYKNSGRWINRVNAMGDCQVIAVYRRMLAAGEILK